MQAIFDKEKEEHQIALNTKLKKGKGAAEIQLNKENRVFR